MVTTNKDLIEELTHKADRLIEGNQTSGLISLMRELIAIKNELFFSSEDRRQIFVLGKRVQDKIIELVEKETERLCRLWQGRAVSPMYLKSVRDNYKNLTADRLPRVLWQTLRSCAAKIQEALDMGSEQSAEKLILTIEDRLRAAEKFLELGEEFWFIESNLDSVFNALITIEAIVHVRTVGLARVAKKRGVSAKNLLDDFKKREKAATDSLLILVREAEKKHREEREIELSISRKEYALRVRREQQENQKEKLQHAVHAIELRNKIAGKAARDFLEIILTNGDVAKANACLVGIKRCEGGIPPILQELYGELLRTQ